MAEKKSVKKKPVAKKTEEAVKTEGKNMKPKTAKAVPKTTKSIKTSKTTKTAKSAKKTEDETKKAEVMKNVEAKIEAKTESVKEMPVKKSHGGVICAVIVTFFITAMLFGMAFFVFMNLDVIDDDGRVRIENGKIYVDNRHRTCTDTIEDVDGKSGTKTDTKDNDSKEDTSTSYGELIDNPNARVAVKGAQLIEVGDFEFYLPKDFEASKANGNGKYVFNLADDDGWADVKVYTEKTTADLMTYMQKKDSLLRLTNSTYYMNGTSWAEMESGSSIAYGTRLGDMLYVVILNVKLESDATGEAEQMIPKTIRMKRIYK